MDTAERTAIDACRSGQLGEFDQLYQRHVDAVYKYLLRRVMIKAVAEDLTSLTFLRAIESMQSFDPSRGEFRPWLYRIARNALIDHYRDPTRGTVDIETVWDLPASDLADDDAKRKSDARQLHAALATLTADQRDVVMLRVWEGLSYKEIAELTGKSDVNCKTIFSRAIADLRGQLVPLLLLFLLPHAL